MRKFYLFFAGALLLSTSAFSQAKFQRYPDEAKIVFTQDFEPKDQTITADSAWRAWCGTPVDTIRELYYYARSGSSSVSGADIYSDDWKIIGTRTDSIIVLYNAVESSTSSKDSAKTPFPYKDDVYKIISDDDPSSDRVKTMALFGEDGGKYYFKYSAKDAHTASGYDATNHNVDKYRRNMYIRGLDIDDYSSYRLTLFLKVKPDSKATERTPLFNADLMRGYHHQRAPFSMGYKSGKAFTYSQESFSGEWEKVTLMSYYINDSVAEAYTYYGEGYQWADDWTWNYNGKEYNYIMQPDKYFIRLAFRTDSVDYSLDNIALTKSMIGGCEYYDDILRVNFGYKTNLKDIVEKRMAIDNIPAVEIPNENNKYIEVWYLDQDGDPDNISDWKPMPIRCAEYHQDGYMYLFTQSYPNPFNPSETISLKFGDKKQVLVTFHNSTDNPDYTLKYTGDFYPKPHDTAWVNAGKIVPSFYNEIAVPNPNIVKGVSSIDGLPPIMTKAPYEDGSFGLPDTTTVLKFKFQKKVKDDATFKGELSENAIAYVGDEVWYPKWSDSESCLMLIRPDTYTTPLKGDYLIHIIHIKGANNNSGDEVKINYHFGDFATVIKKGEEHQSNWRSELDAFNQPKGANPASTYVHDYNTSFRKGDGTKANKAKTRVYLMDYGTETDVDYDNCGYWICSYTTKSGDTKYEGNMYTVINFTNTGDYTIQFKGSAWGMKQSEAGWTANLYFYPNPTPGVDFEAGNDKGFKVLSEVANKIDLGSIEPKSVIDGTTVEDLTTGKWPSDVDLFTFNFNVPAAGEYVFEWKALKTDKTYGLFMGNFHIAEVGAGSNLSTEYVKKLNNALANAKSRLDAANVDKYKGDAFNALAQTIEKNETYKGNFPSKYDSVVAYINDVVNDLALRKDAVDKFHAKEAEVSGKLAKFTGDSAKYQQLTAYTALANHLTANAGWIDSVKTNDVFDAEMSTYEAQLKALDDRMAIITNLSEKIKEVKAVIDAKDARKDYEEYDAMVTGYNTAVAFDDVHCADDAVTEATEALLTCKRAYIFRFDYEIAKTRQIKELCVLADSLGYDFGNKKDSIKAIVNALVDDETALSNVLREAAILQILKIYAGKDAAKIDGLKGYDVSALIPNYFLYNEAQVDRDMDLSSANTWRIIKSVKNTTAFPGWTVFSSGTLYPGQEALDWPVDGHVFIGGLRYTGTSGYVESTILGLPQAYYQVGFNMGTTNISSTYKSTCSYMTVSGTDTIIVAGTKKTSQHTVYIDSVGVKDNNAMTINFTVNSKISSDDIIMNSVVLKLTAPDDKANYEDLVATQEKKLTDLITFVGAPTQKASVEYYNLGGMKIDNPKSGEIIIRKTTQNGKVVVDKVLIK